jgi:hypothetical protein
VPLNFVEHQSGTVLFRNGAKCVPADGADFPVFVDFSGDVAKEPFFVQNLEILSEIAIGHFQLLFACDQGFDSI